VISRCLAFLAAALGALVLGVASTATVSGLVGVDVARAQSPAPSPGTPAGSAPARPPDPEAGLDGTPAGCLDQGGLGGPIDDAGTADVTAADPGSCAATGTDPGTGSTTDPDAGLDDTPVGGLNSTDLGGPIDDTNQPAADPPPTTTPGPSGSDGATPPSAGGAASPASGAPGASPPPIHVSVNVPSSAPIASIYRPRSSTSQRRSSLSSSRSTCSSTAGAPYGRCSEPYSVMGGRDSCPCGAVSHSDAPVSAAPCSSSRGTRR
jgi:hypothetical protein